MTIILFQIPAQRYLSKKVLVKNVQIRHFWSQIQTFSLLHKILQLGKFEDAVLKYDNFVFKLQPNNTQIKHFWSQIQAFLFLSQNFAVKQILRVPILNIGIAFLKFYSESTSDIFGSKFRHFPYFTKPGIQTKPNTQIRHFQSQF